MACSVPELKPTCGALVGDVLPDEVDADGRLSYYAFTFYFSSNTLFTNLSMILVFPVPLSPRKIILYVFLPSVELVIDVLIQLLWNLIIRI